MIDGTKIAFGFAVLLMGACDKPKVTALRLDLDFDSAIRLDQLEVFMDGLSWRVSPRPLEPGTKVFLILDDDQAGSEVTVSIWGYHLTAAVASALVQAIPIRGETVGVPTVFVSSVCDEPDREIPILNSPVCVPVGSPADCTDPNDATAWIGWEPDGEGGCRPILPAEPCTDGQMAVIGQTECQPIDDCEANSCPVAGLVVVEPGDDIQQAVTLADENACLLVQSRDEPYSGGLTIDKALTLEGACPQQGSEGVSIGGRVDITADGVTLRAVTVTGGVVVDGKSGVEMENVVVQDVASSPGLYVSNGAQITVRHSRLSGNEIGILVDGAHSTATLEEVVVRDNGTPDTGSGIRVQTAGSMVVDGCVIDGNHRRGVEVSVGDVKISDSVVRNTIPDGEGFLGEGVFVEGRQSVVDIERGLVTANRTAGISISGSRVTVTETVLSDTLLEESGARLSVGLLAGSDSVVSISRSLVRNNRTAGIFVALSDVQIDHTIVRDNPNMGSGSGVAVIRAETLEDPCEATGMASVDVSQSLLEASFSGAKLCGATGDFEHTVIRDCTQAVGYAGSGCEGNVKLEQCLLYDNAVNAVNCP